MTLRIPAGKMVCIDLKVVITDNPRSQFAPSNSKAFMNKLELIAALAKKQELSKAEAARNEDKVEIRGFCTLKVKNYKGYTGRNPKSGEHVTVKTKKLPSFKAGEQLKKRVDRYM